MLRTTAARGGGVADGGGRGRGWGRAGGRGRSAEGRGQRAKAPQPLTAISAAAFRRSRQRAKRSTIRARMRTGWDQYFMGIAHQAATRATCLRKHVGAVIVRDRTVLSTG